MLTKQDYENLSDILSDLIDESGPLSSKYILYLELRSKVEKESDRLHKEDQEFLERRVQWMKK